MNWLINLIRSWSDQELPQFINRIHVTERVYKDIKRFVSVNARKENPETQQKIAWRFGVSRQTVGIVKRSPSYEYYKINRRRVSKPALYGRGPVL